ncbi:unnamed protein product [[Actinomadura] parvosata subsp. kistnae]|nr:unnamed protein product [Actinomadura parvosata subsp. kistnae]
MPPAHGLDDVSRHHDLAFLNSHVTGHMHAPQCERSHANEGTPLCGIVTRRFPAPATPARA